MLKLLALASLVFCFSLTDLYASRAPYPREVQERFLMLEGDERLLKVAYNFTDNPVIENEHVSLGVSIPDDYLVTHVAVYVDTDVVSLHSNTVGVTCENTSDLLAPNNFADDSEHALVMGAVTSLLNSVRTVGGCTPTMQIGTGPSGIDGGRLIFRFKVQKIEPPLPLRKLDLEP